jgi:predicted metal-dependent hydrolase
LVKEWFMDQAHIVLQERLSVCERRFAREDLLVPNIIIRTMQSSWGSCTRRSTISLNIKLIQVPTEYIDYVLIHELCHLKHFNHAAEFYELLSRVMPNWQEKKDKLDPFDFG